MKKTRSDKGLQAAFGAIGKMSHLARELGVTLQAVAKWERIPADRVIEVESVTGIPREKLRPDLYAAPRPKRPRASAHV